MFRIQKDSCRTVALLVGGNQSCEARGKCESKYFSRHWGLGGLKTRMSQEGVWVIYGLGLSTGLLHHVGRSLVINCLWVRLGIGSGSGGAGNGMGHAARVTVRQYGRACAAGPFQLAGSRVAPRGCPLSMWMCSVAHELLMEWLTMCGPDSSIWFLVPL